MIEESLQHMAMVVSVHYRSHVLVFWLDDVERELIGLNLRPEPSKFGLVCCLVRVVFSVVALFPSSDFAFLLLLGDFGVKCSEE